MSANKGNGLSARASRWLQKDFFKCNRCDFLQRYARGYRPIPNPILFKTDEHCLSWSQEQKNALGYMEQNLAMKCDGCTEYHAEWKYLDFQSYLDEKEKLSPAQQKRYLVKGSARSSKSAEQ